MSTQASRRERRWWTKNEDEILRNWAQGQSEKLAVFHAQYLAQDTSS